MPKQIKPSTARDTFAPYPSPGQKVVAAIWSAADDEVLLKARASGLNWGPIASKYFPSKTANACRKRHERLMERRHAEDWDADKLELLSETYMECRREMWELLAAKLGERWHVLEQKCMEKGLKTLQATARTAQRRASAGQTQQHLEQDQGISDHNSDSGIGLGSDTEMEVGDTAGSWKPTDPSWMDPYVRPQSAPQQHSHVRSLSQPHPIPIYRPPPPPASRNRKSVAAAGSPAEQESMAHKTYHTDIRRCSPDGQMRGISIQSVLSPAEPTQSMVSEETQSRPDRGTCVGNE